MPLTWLVVNAASGSNAPDAVERVETALAPARTLRFPEDDLPDTAALDAAGVEVLAIFAGDGTVGAQMASLAGWTGRVLILPGGTQNLLAKRLHGDAGQDEVLGRFLAGALAPRRISAIRTDHGNALAEVVAGPGATWSDVREELRDRNLAGVATTLAEAIRQSTGGAGVRLSDPPLGNPAGYPAVRLSPTSGGIAVDGYGPETAADVARQGVAILRRDFRPGPHDTLGVHPRVSCCSDAPIELAIDGERTTGSITETFELVQCPVEFLASAGSPG